MPKYLDPALFSALIGLFFLGWLLRQQPVPSGRQCILCVVFIAACTVFSLLLLWLQFEEGVKFWRFMDDRMRPSPMVAISAVCIVLICRRLFDRPMPERAVRLWSELGQCSFAVYLVHQWLINETEFRIYYPLWSHMPAFFAGLVWEAAVFGLSLAMAFVIRRLPGFKKIV